LQAAAILAAAVALWFGAMDGQIGREPPLPLPATGSEPLAPAASIEPQAADEGRVPEAQALPDDDRAAPSPGSDAGHRWTLYLPAIASASGVQPEERPASPGDDAAPGPDPEPAALALEGGALERWVQGSEPGLDLDVSEVRLRLATEALPDPEATAAEGGDPEQAALLLDQGVDVPPAAEEGAAEAALPDELAVVGDVLPAEVEALAEALPGPDHLASPLAPPMGGAGTPAAVRDARWVWPVRGEVSQYYSGAHKAIDISADQGALVVAADAGRVVYAKWQSTGYGYLVIVDHGDGFLTYYAHLYGFYVDVGKRVERGEPLGELGNTGRSTGPHLHFEIRNQGVQQDPWQLLPPP
jgi:hypothetical protein